jgi:hypothetical protein
MVADIEDDFILGTPWDVDVKQYTVRWKSRQITFSWKGRHLTWRAIGKRRREENGRYSRSIRCRHITFQSFITAIKAKKVHHTGCILVAPTKVESIGDTVATVPDIDAEEAFLKNMVTSNSLFAPLV